MIAAIYARKSTGQIVSEEEKSVTRQVEHGRAFATRKGWIADDAYVYMDDGVSGAEFDHRPGLQRLLAALTARPPFGALVVMDESRLGREALETGYLLKRLLRAGVRIFCYLDDRELRFDTATEKMVAIVRGAAADLERDSGRQRTKDAMLRKAKAGHMIGGRRFGYDNVGARSPEGQRLHTEYQVNEAEVAAVRRIFELCAEGFGYLRIAHRLNAEGLPSPRWRPGHPRGWCSSSVRAVLFRDLYRGEIVWNKTAKRNQWGERQVRSRPKDDWVRVPAPHLRVVSDELWRAAHDRLAGSRDTYLRTTRGERWGKPGNGIESKYLLTGLAVCALCGGALTARTGGKDKRPFYRCLTNVQRGASVCQNNRATPMRATDEAVLSTIEAQVLRPEVVSAAIEKAIRHLQPPEDRRAAERKRLEAALATIEAELARLASAVAAGGPLQALVAAIQERERQREAACQRIAALDALGEVGLLDRKRLERDLRKKLDDWKALLLKHVQSARQILVKLLEGRLRFTPNREGYAFEGTGRLEPLLMGAVGSKALVPPG